MPPAVALLPADPIVNPYYFSYLSSVEDYDTALSGNSE